MARDKQEVALIDSIISGNIATVEKLLNAGVNPNLLLAPFESSPLIASVLNDRPEIFDLLLERGATLDPNGEGGENLLYAAAMADDLDAGHRFVKKLLTLGVDAKYLACTWWQEAECRCRPRSRTLLTWCFRRRWFD